MSIAEFDRYYAGISDRNDRIEASRPHVYGGNAQVAGLRCFMAYHKDARMEYVDIQGRSRWMTHKQVALHGLLARLATTGAHTTIRAVALEAHVAPSTASRFMVKLQAWGEYAIDVTRGKYGGITVRRRFHGDHLQAYAKAAWERLRRMADRARLMLRPRSGKEEEGPTTYYLPMDATLKREAAIERLGARILAGEVSVEQVLERSGRATDADREWERAQEWAAEVIAERRRLDREEPDWDLLLEDARRRWLS